MRPVLFKQYNYFLLKNKKITCTHHNYTTFLVSLIKLIYKSKVDFFFDVFTCKYVKKNRIYKQFYLIEKKLKYA